MTTTTIQQMYDIATAAGGIEVGDIPYRRSTVTFGGKAETKDGLHVATVSYRTQYTHLTNDRLWILNFGLGTDPVDSDDIGFGNYAFETREACESAKAALLAL